MNDDKELKPKHVVILLIIFVLLAGVVGRMDADAFAIQDQPPAPTYVQAAP